MVLGFIFILCISVSVTSSYPFHASCQLQWSFPSASCDAVRIKLIQQIKKWNGPDNCQQGGEKCLYELSASSLTNIVATHTTPKKKYVDTLKMQFVASPSAAYLPGVVIYEKFPSNYGTGCLVSADSRSNTWYAILDYGTNYCNLHNLVEGSGLVNTTGFVEVTNDKQCTQYSTADCNTY